MPITYTAGGAPDLDTIARLWEKLRAHHRERSGPFNPHYDAITWEKRKQQLLEKNAGGGLHIDIARDGAAVVGYCVSTVDAAKRGELESLFIEETYRRHGIGTVLMEKALAWLDKAGAMRRQIGVAAGNEEAVPFYRRFGFEPRTIILEQAELDA